MMRCDMKYPVAQSDDIVCVFARGVFDLCRLL